MGKRQITTALWGLILAAALAGCASGGSPGNRPASGDTGRLTVSFLDVGQGDAALVRFPNEGAWLVDGGPPGSEAAVRAALRQAGVQRLQAVVASHPHADHIGGLADLLPAFRPEEALDSGFQHPTPVLIDYLRAVKVSGARFRTLRAGERLEPAPGVHVEVLAPTERFIRGSESDVNNNSVVFRLTFGRIRFLFTGDLERAGRERIYHSSQAGWLPAEVLKVAHHGSANGTDAAWLRRVRPQIAIISCGRGNEYGHPHWETLAALGAARVRVYRTDRNGTITVSTDGRSIQVSAGGASRREEGERSASEGIPTGGVVGNAASRVYHTPECASLPSSARRMPFASRSAAEAAGYRPHAACVHRPR
ncbi:MAG: MBL fold metallo-hydrolase [Armatimonadetes bacterium]|nr:MBL fold metallo-hydrolase [Armatimonadota bacterium]